MKTFNNVAQMKLASLRVDQFVETGGYYTKGDAGQARYLIVAAQAADEYGDHTLANGTVAVLQTGDTSIIASQYGVGAASSADALQSCLDKGQADNKEVILPSGIITIEKIITGIKRVTMRGSGRDDTTIQSSGNYTVFEHTTNFRVSDLTLENISGINEGIGFGNQRSDDQANQALNCVFERVAVKGFDFSWWLRASVWCSWRDCYSNSLVGLRLARNANPYDVISDAPSTWNEFNPIGWFHNAGIVENCNFEDDECGIYGCPMAYSFLSPTTQGQNGDKANNKILAVTEERTGIWLQSGFTGTRNAWSNMIVSHYTEACRRPCYIQDQRSLTSISGFMQGGSISVKYPTPFDVDNSVVYIESVVGQDYFDNRAVVRNNGVMYGKTENIVTGGNTDVQDTSRLFENREFESYLNKYSFSTGVETASFTLPVTLANDSHYVLKVGGLYNGSSIRNASFNIFKRAGDALTSIVLSSGATTNFNITAVGNKLVVGKTGSFSFDFKVVLEEISTSISVTTALTAD